MPDLFGGAVCPVSCAEVSAVASALGALTYAQSWGGGI